MRSDVRGPRASRIAGLLMLAAGAIVAAQAQAPASPVSFRADLSSAERLDAWTLDGSGAWTIRDGLLLLEKAGVPAGPIRRPGALAILKTPALGDSSIEVELRSDAPEDVIRRDLLLVAGWQSPTRHYYVHLSAIRDDVHNGIFVVDNADRRRIDDNERPAGAEGSRLAHGAARPDRLHGPAGGLRRRRDHADHDRHGPRDSLGAAGGGVVRRCGRLPGHPRAGCARGALIRDRPTADRPT